MRPSRKESFRLVREGFTEMTVQLEVAQAHAEALILHLREEEKQTRPSSEGLWVMDLQGISARTNICQCIHNRFIV